MRKKSREYTLVIVGESNDDMDATEDTLHWWMINHSPTLISLHAGHRFLLVSDEAAASYRTRERLDKALGKREKPRANWGIRDIGPDIGPGIGWIGLWSVIILIIVLLAWQG
ncbi:MAG: hypothetical protein OXE52_04960 [Chloroflexi bacterium]|nr:hypothetical protein [Chloroflexota bacterium]